MTETDPLSVAGADALPLEPAKRLRELLDQPKPKAAEWQEEAARMVSLLAIRFPEQTDEVAAFTSVALVGLASAKGVKEARKRTLKLTRWSSSPPPPLGTLTRRDEQRAALMALAKVRTPWGKLYAERALIDDQLDSDLLPDLMRWARASAPDWPAFVADTLAPAVAASSNGARAAVLLKDAQKLVKLSNDAGAQKVAEALAALSRTAVESAGRPGCDPKIKVAIRHAGFGIVEQAWHALPSLLLQPSLVAALGQLAAAAGPKDKASTAALESASMATVSLVADVIQRFGADASEQSRLLLPVWTGTYPNFEKHFKLAAASQPALAELLAKRPEGAKPLVETYAAESVFAGLLPAWDAFMADLPDPSRAASLTSMMKRAAGAVGVEPMGVVGEVIDYDPLSHRVSGGGQVSLGRVRILRAGVMVRRTDGSVRTLVEALVEPA